MNNVIYDMLRNIFYIGTYKKNKKAVLGYIFV